MAIEKGLNMELRALLAVVLSLLVLVVSQYFFASPPAGQTPATEALPQAPGGGGGETAGVEGGSDEARPEGPGLDVEPAEAAVGAAVAADTEDAVVVETALYRATLTNRGARISSFILKDYVSDQGGPLELVREEFAGADELPLGILTPERAETAAAVNEALFVTSVDGGRARQGVRWADDRPVVVRWQWSDGTRTRVEKSLSFPADGYLVELEAKLWTAAETPAYLGVGPGLVDAADTSTVGFYLTRGAVLLQGGEVEHRGQDDLQEPQLVEAPVAWAGVESNYFACLFITGDRAHRLLMSSEPLPSSTVAGSGNAVPAVQSGETGGAGAAAVRLGLEVPADGLRVPLYLGPKQYDLLAAHGHQLERAVDFGFFGLLAYPLLVALKWIHGYVGNYGLAIILLTVVIKVVFLPLTQSSLKSMRKMQKLQPQMAAIRARYKGVKDMQKRQEMNAEIMALYKQHGVSPMGGCFPMLLQFPVLFAFYALLSLAIEIRHAPFMLWITDLSKHDPYLVLPILMGASMYAQQRMSPTTADPMQARIFRMMPVMFTVFFLWLPSGLVLYWLVNNLLAIAQQGYVNRQMDASGAIAAPVPAGGGKDKKGRKGGKGKKGKGGRRKKRGKR